MTDFFHMLYAFFWVIPQRLNSDAVELTKGKHTTFRTCKKFEIKNFSHIIYNLLFPNILQFTAIESMLLTESVKKQRYCAFLSSI